MKGAHFDIKKLDHVGILVNSLENSIPCTRDTLGLAFDGIASNEKLNVEIAVFKVGDVLLTLLEPKAEGRMKDDLEKRGEGVHHICFEVDDIVETLKELKAKNTPLVDSTPRPGARGSKIAFLERTSESNHVLVELIER